MKAQVWRSPSCSIQICTSRQGGGLLHSPGEMVDKEGRGRRIYHYPIGVASCENVQDEDGHRARRRRADRSFRTETYDIGFYARNNAPAVGVVHSRKTKVGTMCFKFSLRLASLSLSLRETIFFPIPRNRRRYVGIRSVRFYESCTIFFLLPVVIFFCSCRREKVEMKSHSAYGYVR